MIKRVMPIYYFSMECFVLYLLLFLLYIPSGQHPPVLAFLIMLMAANLVLYLALKRAEISALYLLLGMITSAGIGFAFGLGKISALISIFYLFRRSSAFIKDFTLWKEERSGLAIIFYFSSLLVLFDSWVVGYREMNLLYALPIFFTLFYSTGRYLQQMEHDHQLRYVNSLISFVAISGFSSWLITLILPFVKWAFFGLLQTLLIVVGFLARPILNLVEGKKLDLKIIRAPKDDEDQGSGNNIIHRIAMHTHLEVVPYWVWLSLLIVLFIGIFIFINRKKIEARSSLEKTSSVTIEQTTSLFGIKRKLPFLRERAPHDYIRKMLFELLQFAAKNNMGRYSNETVREWFDRFDLPKNEELLLAYEQVRYGNASITKTEGAKYSSAIEELKHEIKIRSEKNKERI